MNINCSSCWFLAFVIRGNLALKTNILDFHLLMLTLNSVNLIKLSIDDIDQLSETADILNNTLRIAQSPVICTQLTIFASPAEIM